MDFELWFLVVVPLMFASGWWLRGLDIRQMKRETQGIDDHYFKGLSLLLSDEPDKAIDLFIEVVRLDPETIELHHALGNLFRRRGQFDRAIRLHSYLANRAELAPEERAKALSELALDYLKAGTYDRAEAAYEALAGFKGRENEAHKALMHIYCTEREWQKAVETAELLEARGMNLSLEVSHYYCELALLARQAKDADRAREFVNRALAAESSNPRALALKADLDLAAGKSAEALKDWDTIESVKPAYVPLFAAKKADVIAETDRNAALDYLKDVFARTGSVDVLTAAVARMAGWCGEEPAERFASEALRQKPSLSALAVLSDLKSKTDPENEQAKLLASITARQSKQFARYQCRNCGFLAHTFTWQCPGCESWESFPPQRVEEGKKPSGY